MPVYISLIVINIVCFLWSLAFPELIQLLALSGAVFEGQLYRLVTAGFLHGGWVHIAMNMAGLFWLGRLLEPLTGRSRFLIIYGIALLGGSIFSVLFHGADPKFLGVGASGAIFGLLGGIFGLTPLLKKHGLQRPYSWWNLIGILVLSAGANVDNAAHVGGLVAGFVVARVMAWTARD